MLQEGESLTKEQIEHEIKKLKEAHVEDEGIICFSRLTTCCLLISILATRSMHFLWRRWLIMLSPRD